MLRENLSGILKNENDNFIYVSVELIDGSVDKIKSYLDEIDVAGKKLGYTNIEVTTEWHRYEDTRSLMVYGNREETDEEFENRMERNKKQRERTEKINAERLLKKDDRDHKTWKRLNKRFGNERK